MRALCDAHYVKAVSLDKVSTENDIHMYVSKQLEDRPDIGAVEINKIVRRADGLFKWARLACRWIGSDTAGETVKERFDDLMVPTSQEGAALLDKMYVTVLKSVVVKKQRPLAWFHSLM